MAAAGVHLAERIFERIADQRILFVGAGEMIALCATHFAARQPKELVIANRTLERGVALAERFGGSVMRLDEIADRLGHFDIVVSCTASPLPIIGWAWSSVRSRRAATGRCSWSTWPCRRDIEVEVGQLDDVFSTPSTTLAQVVESGLESRQAAVVEAEAIIAARSKPSSAGSKPATRCLIRTLRDAAERTRRHEMEHALKLLAKGESPDKVLEQLSHRLTNKFLHAPTQALNSVEADERETLRCRHPSFHLHGE